jgi:hypothetical protein
MFIIVTRMRAVLVILSLDERCCHNSTTSIAWIGTMMYEMCHRSSQLSQHVTCYVLFDDGVHEEMTVHP